MTEAAVIAALCFLSAVPYLYYLTHVAFTDRLLERFSSVTIGEVIRADLVMVASVSVLCALVGSLASRRYGLGGLGLGTVRLLNWRRFVGLAAGLGALTYLLFGRTLARNVPGYYPSSLMWAAMMPIKGALFEETVARYGMMTVVTGIARRPMVANLIQAAFFTLMMAKGLDFYGVSAQGQSILLLGLVASTMLLNVVYGWAYARLGLTVAAILHAVVDLRFVVHALL